TGANPASPMISRCHSLSQSLRERLPERRASPRVIFLALGFAPSNDPSSLEVAELGRDHREAAFAVVIITEQYNPRFACRVEPARRDFLERPGRSSVAIFAIYIEQFGDRRLLSRSSRQRRRCGWR